MDLEPLIKALPEGGSLLVFVAVVGYLVHIFLTKGSEMLASFVKSLEERDERIEKISEKCLTVVQDNTKVMTQLVEGLRNGRPVR